MKRKEHKEISEDLLASTLTSPFQHVSEVYPLTFFAESQEIMQQAFDKRSCGYVSLSELMEKPKTSLVVIQEHNSSLQKCASECEVKINDKVEEILSSFLTKNQVDIIIKKKSRT
ncbi:hypothetical protein Zmor_003787 [Zophobas morio]|uniref:Uncharacterized protein n=1 Tax=Zophobas morio TaxID=2755281 RepID=A0AA38M1M6_9CUCU|nr:hypothetical protein Zmor_003787 [Zophobas morio]